MIRPTWAEVDLEAVRHNVRALVAAAAPARLCVVVKADAYGHGAVAVSRAALEAGAAWLAVALVEEGMALRQAGIAAPVLLLSEPPAEALDQVVAHQLTPTLYTWAGIEGAAKAVAGAGGQRLGVHLKVDTGMHRVGAGPDESVALAMEVAHGDELWLEGLWSHLAVADEPDDPFTGVQQARLEAVRARLAQAGIRPPLVHLANSAGVIAHPSCRYDLVRCGIALYGYPPSPGLAGRLDLRPVLSLRSRVALVKELDPGERVSYGLRYALPERGVVATVPVGYADGVPRRWGSVGGQVLVGGLRHPIAGTVTMDQITVDCGPGADVRVGDEAVLIGRQGQEAIGAADWASALGTISYEILCGISPRVPRQYRG